MRPRRRRPRAEDPSRRQLLDNYARLVFPLQLYLFMKCAPQDIDPRHIADTAYADAFSDTFDNISYSRVRDIADSLHREQLPGAAHRPSDYRLVAVFDDYFPNELPLLRRGIARLDQLSSRARNIERRKIIVLLRDEGVADVLGATPLQNLEQVLQKLARLPPGNAQRSVLEPFIENAGETP